MALGQQGVGGGLLCDRIAALLQRAPQWARDDFASKDASRRNRAQESLAAMLIAAIEERPRDRSGEIGVSAANH